MGSKTAMDFLEAQTRRLEAMGLVFRADTEICLPCRMGRHAQCINGEPARPLHPHPKAARKRLYASDYDRLKAHRRRKSRMITK